MNPRDKKIIAATSITLVFLAGVGLYFFFSGVTPGSELKVSAVEAATGSPIPSAEISIGYLCKDRLGAETTCSLGKETTNAEGVASFNKAFVSGRDYIISAVYKENKTTYLGSLQFNFQRGESPVVPVMGPRTAEFCVEAPFHFEEDVIKVADFTRDNRDQFKLYLDLGSDTLLRIREVEIVGFGKATGDMIVGNVATVRGNPLNELRNGCYSYAVKISYDYGDELGITGVSEGTLSGAFWAN